MYLPIEIKSIEEQVLFLLNKLEGMNFLVVIDDYTSSFWRFPGRKLNITQFRKILFSEFLDFMDSLSEVSTNFFLFEVFSSIFRSEESYFYKELKNQIKGEENIIFLNPYLSNNSNYLHISFKGEKILEKNNSFTKILTEKELSRELFFRNKDNYKLLLGAKILSSSFFLNEFLEFYTLANNTNPVLKYKIPENYYFSNIGECVNFFIDSDIGILPFDFPLLKQESIKNAFLFLKKNTNWEENDFILDNIDIYRSNFFYNNIILHNSDLVNDIKCNKFWLSNIEIKNKYCKERILELGIETQDDPYFYYMNTILGFSIRSLRERWLRIIYKYVEDRIKGDTKARLSITILKIFGNGISQFFEEILPSLRLNDKQLFYEGIPAFIVSSSRSLDRAKKFCRKNGLATFYSLDIIEKFTSKVTVRKKSNFNKFLKIKY